MPAKIKKVYIYFRMLIYYVTEILRFCYKFDKPIAKRKQVMYNKNVQIKYSEILKKSVIKKTDIIINK